MTNHPRRSKTSAVPAHTPTPWYLSKVDANPVGNHEWALLGFSGWKTAVLGSRAASPVVIGLLRGPLSPDTNGWNNADLAADANAAFIVHTVNAHDTLVAALKALLGDGGPLGQSGHIDYAEAVKMARAALAAAEGR